MCVTTLSVIVLPLSLLLFLTIAITILRAKPSNFRSSSTGQQPRYRAAAQSSLYPMVDLLGTVKRLSLLPKCTTPELSEAEKRWGYPLVIPRNIGQSWENKGKSSINGGINGKIPDEGTDDPAWCPRMWWAAGESQWPSHGGLVR